MKTLIVVSGGDAPGINTLIARYISLANTKGHTVLGAKSGFSGVMHDNIRELTLADVAPFSGLGGSILASSREPVLAAHGAQERLKVIMARHDIDNILLFGGNGSLTYIPPLLKSWGIPSIGIPTTIDNDVAGTERTLGFDSACNFAYHSIEGVIATAHALPGRIFMVETLGGETGYIALEVALGSGAHLVLLPEYEYEDDWLADRLMGAVTNDGYALGILSEEAPRVAQLHDTIPQLTGIRLRYVRLGHAQRGGSVTHVDRRLAFQMARVAYEGFLSGIDVGTVLVREGRVILYNGGIGEFTLRPPDWDLYAFVNGLS